MSTETDNAWREDVQRVYREVVAAADPQLGIQRQEAMGLASEKLTVLVAAGKLSIPIGEAIRAALLEADRLDGVQADRVLARIISGQATLDLADDPTLSVVVALGRGRRKSWRLVTLTDLADLDSNRYANVTAATDAYAGWRRAYTPAANVLAKFATVGDAVAAGAFGSKP